MSETPTAQDRENAYLRAELAKVRETLGTLITWMAQSANSPLSRAEAEMLLRTLVQS